MEQPTSNMSKILAVFICLAMVLSSTVIISHKASAEIITGTGQSIPEMPPIPPYTIFGILHCVTGAPVSDATVTIANLRTAELLDADVYENGAYEGVLEDLPSGYAVDDNIEISVVSGLTTTSKIVVVEHLGFGKRVDFNLGDKENNASNENVIASSSKVQNNPTEITMMNNIDSPSSLNAWPERIAENAEPIIIDSIETTSLLKELSPDDLTPSHKSWRGHPPIPRPIDTTDIVLKDIRAPPGYRYALDDQRTPLKLILENVGDSRYTVLADLTNIKPDGSEEFITTLRFGAINPHQEKTRLTFWQPDTVGENYVRVDVKIRQRGRLIPMESYEASFAVVPSENVIYWQDKVIDEPQEFYNMTIIVFGDLDINAKTSFYNSTLVIDPGNTTINATTIWSGLAGPWLMDTPIDGGTWIKVTKNGTFKIELGALVTSTDTTTPTRYQFTVNGALNIDSSTVEYVWGNTSDLSQPGGIICTTDNILIENGATVRNGATHGIWLSNSSARILGSRIHDNGGDGIVVVDGSAPVIEGNTVEWNGRYGINANGSVPIIRNNPLIQYNGLAGIQINNVSNATAIINKNIIKQNVVYGINADNTNITITNNTISSNGMNVIFSDGMESAGNWTYDGLWHRVNKSAVSAPAWNLSHSDDWSWWYGNDVTGDYNTSSRNFGNLTSPVISVPSLGFYGRAVLSFWSWYDTDTSGIATDQRQVTIYNRTSNINRTVQLYGDDNNTWVKQYIDILDFAGRDIQLNFYFDTINYQNNSFQGWYIDDVEIVGSYPGVVGYGINCENNATPLIENNKIELSWYGIYSDSSSPNITTGDYIY